MYKKIIKNLIIGCFCCLPALADRSYQSSVMESWIDTKREADICVASDHCNIVFNQLTEQPTLWIGKTYLILNHQLILHTTEVTHQKT